MPYLPTYVNVKQNGVNLIDKDNFRYRPAEKVRKTQRTYFACVEKKKFGCKASVVVDDKTKELIKMFISKGPFAIKCVMCTI